MALIRPPLLPSLSRWRHWPRWNVSRFHNFSSQRKSQQCLCWRLLINFWQRLAPGKWHQEMGESHGSHFCLRPSAKDQGIIWVVVVILLLLLVLVLHLVHFLSKRSLREKNSPQLGFEPGTSWCTVWHSTNWARVTLFLRSLKIIYLFQKSRRRPWTSIGRHLL